eukprot:CAMPEP_0177176598 /NCGR_PEP_ID=MMETSP0367-20130122/13338_1 /TAXON_ID=447022 ORGANISM="Scrippsiella hangoei-like, Strain SHHI-4" /NCGR_SAMPLE_ID=MMETSP0367 /ASSEMBLY_ACC=CAM_ASM_000362 /LENGTH=142 /DNA_ID=CAMNT_0018623115 /DNA_START=379 /DNA_END=804 /DNA_ORIENTATION=-
MKKPNSVAFLVIAILLLLARRPGAGKENADKLPQQRHVEHDVDPQAPHARAAVAQNISLQLLQGDAEKRQGRHELNDLQPGHPALPRRRYPQQLEAVVRIHDHVHERVEEQTRVLQCLAVLQPIPNNHGHERMVVHVEGKVW